MRIAIQKWCWQPALSRALDQSTVDILSATVVFMLLTGVATFSLTRTGAACSTPRTHILFPLLYDPAGQGSSSESFTSHVLQPFFCSSDGSIHISPVRSHTSCIPHSAPDAQQFPSSTYTIDHPPTPRLLHPRDIVSRLHTNGQEVSRQSQHPGESHPVCLPPRPTPVGGTGEDRH